jgi:adenosylcobinamide kinase/adenosylcobinamide-phosphate guanylyltransferase
MFKTEFKQGCMLVLGGARSGKSSFSLDTCNNMEGEHIFIATAQALDDEMEERINKHKADRGRKWMTIEEPVEIAARLRKLDKDDAILLLDCLTLWLNNIFMENESDTDEIYGKIDEVIELLKDVKGRIVIVSNEVGMGIVPENRLSREYRDASGYMNREIGEVACKVVIHFAGLPIILKDE